ncbi:MAG: 5-formyltetrahydrofolate cyclo-ligase [Candidatus Omnitrophica bacterium]|jgi:5-formyltetrahydrofolate cyclo-ligase|nr:5-formyltetrahydrofolate cyclo-ligase [Candidatus Omnitrophota bacterium]
MASKSRDIALTKQSIRNRILVRLKTQKEGLRTRKSGLIAKKLFRTRAFMRAKIVMFYKAFKGEVDTEIMIKAAQKSGKIVVVPVCGENRALIPCILKDGAHLLRGPYGIWEPAVKKSVPFKSIDLVIVPGLAFTRKGKRLGRGKGYYDRFLLRHSVHAATIGLAYDFQVLADLPTNAMDVNVQKVIAA